MRRWLLLALVGLCCGPAPLEASPTGHTVHVRLEIARRQWEVAPGAIYDAVTYGGQMPGPIIEATAGDDIEVELVNQTSEPRSIHTHVSRFAAEDDGFHAGVAPPGGTITVRWRASFPGTFPYHDHASAGEDGIAAGLFGAVVVHDPAAPRAAHENVVVLSDLEAARFVRLPESAVGTHAFLHTINGRAFPAWVPEFTARVGERVRWRVVSIGKETHTFHVHGHRWRGADGQVIDDVLLGPGMSTTLEWVEDAPGGWLYHCHMPDHLEGGMAGWYRVSE